MTNRTIKLERKYLNDKLKESENRKKKTMLGGYVTDVDHSDLIVAGQTYHMGSQFLAAIGKDPESMKEQAMMKIDEEDEKYRLDTMNSMRLRESFFLNVLKGRE